MQELPLADPGTPDLRSPGRYLFWLLRMQGRLVIGGIVVGVIWMGCQALVPAVLGKAIDDGLIAKNAGALIGWSLALLGVGALAAVAGVMRHRYAVQNWLGSAYRTVQLVTRKATDLGATLPKRLATGEVVSVGTSDIEHLGGAIETTARFAGAIAAFIIVSVILLTSSVKLGLLVLIGVPVLLLIVTPLLRPLHKRQGEYRARISDLSTLGSDIVGGLRVLRGIGGEQTFAGSYRTRSRDVRAAGLRVASVESLLDGMQVLLPGIFVVTLVWLGARMVVADQLSVGELVAFYGYAAFLASPLRNATDFVHRLTRALVASKRTIHVLGLTSDVTEPTQPVSAPRGDLFDPRSGVCIAQGRITAVASDAPEAAAELADRLGRYADDSEATLAGVRLANMSRTEVRERILVAHTEATMFTGLLRDELDPRGTASSDAVMAALETASAADILEALPEGLEAEVEERGRSFSGGQRQRLLLARALLADPEILVLVEPTSAVDAHTEARIASRLRASRGDGRTTVVMTTSPLVLDRVDQVIFLRDGKVVAEGTHHELLATEPEYRALVTRGEAA